MVADVLAGRYRLEARIAVGGMGQVWRGRDLALSRSVAIKFMNDSYAGDPDAPARFKAEARYAGTLCHQGIAKIYDFRECDWPFLVMELVEGPSLAQLLNGGGLLELGWALDVIAQVAWALQATHSAGIVHQDVKPANLLVGQQGLVKLTDFGIACRIGSVPVNWAGMISGTSAYLAPERLAGARAAAASDLYSLGVVLYECLTGARPFTGTALEIALAHQLREPPPLPVSTPMPVIRLVADLMNKDPLRRPGRAASVAVRAARLRDQLQPSPAANVADETSWRCWATEAMPAVLGPTLTDVFA